VLTHELKLFERILEKDEQWFVKKSYQVAHGGHNPRIYLLGKKNEARKK